MDELAYPPLPTRNNIDQWEVLCFAILLILVIYVVNMKFAFSHQFLFIDYFWNKTKFITISVNDSVFIAIMIWDIRSYKITDFPWISNSNVDGLVNKHEWKWHLKRNLYAMQIMNNKFTMLEEDEACCGWFTCIEIFNTLNFSIYSQN